tara:strand:+ start:233 stop:544 length:312 start_codon:yes stop_codon:yes gene_type:complete
MDRIFPTWCPSPISRCIRRTVSHPGPIGDPLDGKPGVQRIKQRHWGTDTYQWSDWQPLVSAYFGEISLIDEAIGSVPDHLAEAGLEGDTLVIVTTDHGGTIGA